jgi:hypothetical protein
MPLHLTKVAFGAQSLDEIRTWFAGRGDEARLTTRNLPKRADEIAPPTGEHGSLFWIYKHQLVARSPILRFEPAPERGTHIVIEARMILLHPQARRAHQGWRYLDAADAPADLGAGDVPGEALPADLASELARLGLV